MAQHNATLKTLELGRFVAASLVMLSHILWDVPHFAARHGEIVLGGFVPPGAVGVQFFFVLSGFVMMLAHHEDFGQLAAVPRFWWRRALRIYPMYWLGLLVPVYYLSGFLHPGLTAALVTLVPVNVHEFVPAAWSLRYEMAFYAMFGLCLLPRVGLVVLAGWVLVVVWFVYQAYRPVSLEWLLDPPFMYPLDRFFYAGGSRFVSFFELYFFAGLGAGWLFVRRLAGVFRGWASLCAGVVLLAAGARAVQYGYGYPNPPMAPVLAAGFAGVILGLAWLERAGVIKLGARARLLGAMSYPLYIVHMPLMLLVDVQCGKWLRLGPVALYVFAFACVAGIYAIIWAATICLDQPVQRYVSARFWTKKSPGDITRGNLLSP
ncbi:MAG: acyltransferase [Acidocella sp.]|nr:acyltransferase [Acidocella sp.]